MTSHEDLALKVTLFLVPTFHITATNRLHSCDIIVSSHSRLGVKLIPFSNPFIALVGLELDIYAPSYLKLALDIYVT